jgi:hypothetical protein
MDDIQGKESRTGEKPVRSEYAEEFPTGFSF